MTFDELVREVSKKHPDMQSHGRPALSKISDLIRDALNIAADAAMKGRGPVFPTIGRFVSKETRSTGRKPDGTVWTRAGRTKLGFIPSVHRGGRGSGDKSAISVPASSTAA